MSPLKRLLLLWFIVSTQPLFAAERWRDGLTEQNGLVVEVGSRSRLAELVAASGRIGLAVLPHETEAEKARGEWGTKGLLGQVSAVAWQGRIPVNDRSALHVVVDAAAIQDCTDAEILRVLQPGGRAWIGKGETWRSLTGKKPPGIDDWGQYNYDASASEVSSDRLVGPARGLQWVSGPQTKSKKGVRISDGVCVSIEKSEGADAESLVGRDAWSGLVLWRRDDVVPGSRYGWIAGLGRVFFYPESKQNEAPARSMVVLDLHTGRDVAKLDEGIRLDVPKELPRDARERQSIFRPLAAKTEDVVARLTDDGLLVQVMEETVVVLDVKNGKRLWRHERDEGRYMHPVVLGDSVYLCEGVPVRSYSYTHWPALKLSGVVAFGLRDGKQRWHLPWKGDPTVVYNLAGGAGHLVGSCRADERKGDHTVLVIRAEDGHLVYSGQTAVHRGSLGGGHSAARSFIAGDRLWTHTIVSLPGSVSLANPAANDKADLRYSRLPRPVGCTAYRAAGDWIFGSLSAFSLTGDARVYHTDVARTACDVGAFPAQGLQYITPNHCFCQPYVPGSAAFHPRPFAGPEDNGRLARGTARPAPVRDDPDGWPMFLRDNRRSAWTNSNIDNDLKLAWTQDVGRIANPSHGPHETITRSWNDHWFIQGPITQPTVAEGVLVFGLSHQHQVLACDPATGEERWRVPVDGRIDSAPTIYRGLVLAGTRMGSIYALNRDTGELVWRFRAAPRHDTLIADGQVESVWPCFGSVNVDERGVMAVAGRHTDTDGGLWWWRLDPATGEVQGQGRFGADELKMQTYGGGNPGRTIATGSNTPAVMTVGRNAIPSGQNGRIGNPSYGHFLLAGVHARRNEKGDLTDDNALWPEGGGGERERAFWRVRHQTGILVPGNQGLLHRPGYLGGYKLAAYSLTQGIFYAWKKETGDFVMVGGANMLQHRGGSGGGTLRRLRRFPEVESREVPLAKDPRRTTRRIRGAETLWELPDHKQPWRGTGCSALAVAGDTALVGFTISNRDRWREREEQANRVRLISMKDGSTLADLPLPSPPVTSGLAVAHGRVYVSCSDGTLCCFGP